MEDEDVTKMSAYMKQILEDYANVRSHKLKDFTKDFWDIVVITTADQPQQTAFQLQVEEKRQRQELPDGLPIHIVTDPPGIRIGNGGSTLTAMEFLENEYGSNMYKKKILMIHAGGWSQRMPNATILGKVFSLLPHGDSPYQMLDLKLALYWPFVNRLEPGVFVTCADDFVVYRLDDGEWKIPANGFTALAHPSPIEVGRTHGVFVLKNVEDIDKTSAVEVRKCLQILQKPNDDRMRSHGALLPGNTHKFADSISVDGEAVYTDSSFYFGADIMEKLLNYKKSVGDLGCEIDAYGDFLQAVGENATNDYITLTSNVSQPTANLLSRRQEVFDCLKGSDVHVLVMNASKFVHVGTTKELIHHLCQDKVFQKEMALSKDVFNFWANQDQGEGEKQDKIARTEVSTKSCIMHSYLCGSSVVSSNCVLDFCHFDIPVTIQHGCIVSNCQILQAEAQNINSQPTIPSDIFIHTVPIFVDNVTHYVTVFFQTDNNLKKSVLVQEVDSLSYMSSTIESYLVSQGIDKADILPDDCKRIIKAGLVANGVEEKKVSLWNLKLFPALSTMTLSFQDALSSLSGRPIKRASRKDCLLYSLADLLRLKDVKSMLSFRSTLYKLIKEKKVRHL